LRLLFLLGNTCADERQLSQRLQQQLNEATMELQQRSLDFELGGGGAAAQRMQHELTELSALRTCNNDLLAEVRALQKDLRAKDFLLAAQKSAAAAAAQKSSALVLDLNEQVGRLLIEFTHSNSVVFCGAGMMVGLYGGFEHSQLKFVCVP
jgi:hypothetical protein